MLRSWALPVLVAAFAGCAAESEPRERERGALESPGAAPASASAEPPREWSRCAERIAEAVARPGVEGTPVFDGQRAIILARAHAHPSVFRRPPRNEPVEAYSKLLRERILSARVPAYELYDQYSTVVARRARARDVLLSEGYLYAEHPGLALGLATVVRLEHLFDDPEVFIHRGARILRAVRRDVGTGSAYFYEGGTEDGRLAQIFLLDRVATSRKKLEDPLHVDLVPLARQLGFDEASVRRMTDDTIVADLLYGDMWVPSLLSVSGASVELACEMPPLSELDSVARYRSEATARERLLSRQRAVISEQISEQLPFDEPKTEVGQQDGKLRQEWSWAYRYGRTRFEFNEDRYYVFDRHGRPRVPQVCIDFIRDTYERTSGSWYGGRDEPRKRRPGRLDFRQFEMENERSVESFVGLAESHPEWFDVRHLGDDERIPLIRRSDFFAYLKERRHDFRPGDVVIIYGLRDDEKMHYHSFFVFMSDPITGMPVLVAANAGRPRIRSWEGEMQNAPLRSIRTRIRPRTGWLESITDNGDVASSEEEPGGGAPI